jgi:general nucleoside transport system permease protein
VITTRLLTRHEHFRRSIQAQLFELLLPLGAVAAALLVGAFVIGLSGLDPARAYVALGRGSLGSVRSFSETLVRFCPLALCALAVLVAFRSGFFTVGIEGQFYMGALATTVIALKLHAPSVVLALVSMFAGILAGALWALVAGVLKVKLGVNEVISTIMLNAIATLFLDYLVRGPLRAPNTELQYTAMIPRAAWIPHILAGTRLHLGVLIPILAAVLIHLFFWRTSAGYDVRVSGSNPVAARHAGINVGRSIMLAVAISGGLAGLAGAIEVQAVFHRLQAGIGSDYGYTAIPIALVGKTLPGATLLASLFFAALSVGATMMQLKAAVPLPLVVMLQGLVILFVIGSDALQSRFHNWRQLLVPEDTPQDPKIMKGTNLV